MSKLIQGIIKRIKTEDNIERVPVTHRVSKVAYDNFIERCELEKIKPSRAIEEFMKEFVQTE